MTWAWDAPSGVYQNSALSSKIREQAAANSQFARWLSPEPGYGKGKGASVTVTRVLQLPLAGRVSETDRLPSGRPAISTVQKAVSEWGFKIEMTEFEENLTHFDLRNRFQRMLRDQIRLTVDKMAADALKTSPICAIPSSASAITFDTDGTPSSTGQANLTVAHLRLIRDYLATELKAPPFRNGNYVGILSTRAARGIKNDSTYQAWLSPTQSEPFISGRMRMVEGIELFETNHVTTVSGLTGALNDAFGNGDVQGEAIFFGDDPGFFAEVQTPELRAGVPEDLGRMREVGWVGTLEAGLTWDTAATARVIRFTSDS